jgi:HNH endonuclease
MKGRNRNSLFKELLQQYNMLGFDKHTKEAVGEPDKSKRVCRFCGRKQPDVTFKNVAHAISESLGNKKIILYEECDECNARFGYAFFFKSLQDGSGLMGQVGLYQ